MENVIGFEADGFFSLHTTFCRDRACAGAWNGEVYMLKMNSPRALYGETIRVTFDDADMLADYLRQAPMP